MTADHDGDLVLSHCSSNLCLHQWWRTNADVPERAHRALSASTWAKLPQHHPATLDTCAFSSEEQQGVRLQSRSLICTDWTCGWRPGINGGSEPASSYRCKSCHKIRDPAWYCKCKVSHGGSGGYSWGKRTNFLSYEEVFRCPNSPVGDGECHDQAAASPSEELGGMGL